MAGVLDPIPFVGRVLELGELAASLSAARDGNGTVALIAGEPGIGKTRLLDQLARRARSDGLVSLVGRSYDSEGMPPYLMFAEALGDHAQHAPLDELRSQLGEGAADVALVVRSLRSRLPDLPKPLERRWDRYQLFESVADFILGVARSNSNGALLALDDLHWADKPSLLLFQHLARKVAGAPLVIVGTYRPDDVRPDHPLADALADLSREHVYRRLLLPSLSRSEVDALIAGLTGVPAAPQVAEAVYRGTEGNPFFVREVVRHLGNEGSDLTDPATRVTEWSVPEGVRQVIGKRVFRLGSDARRLLQAGAVLGEGFAFDVLETVLGADAPTADAVDALDEALAAGLLREESESYHFTHALVREYLYSDLSLPRRQRLHLSSADAIERTRPLSDGVHVAEIANHLVHAIPLSDTARTIQYARQAGERAHAVFAYEEAVKFYESALRILDAAATLERCDLLLALGEAQMPLGEPRRVANSLAAEAFAIAEEHGDRNRASRAARMVLEALHRDGPLNTDTPEWRAWANKADQYAAPGTPDRAYADVALARAAIGLGDRANGVELLERALALARSVGDPELLFTCAWQAIYSELGPRHWRRAVALAEEFAIRPRAGVRIRTVGQILEMCAAGLFAKGDRAGAEHAWHELGDLASRTHDAFNEINAMSYEGLLATVDGRLEEAVAIARRIIALGEERGMPRVAAQFTTGRCGRAFLYLGLADELDRLSGPEPYRPFRPALAAYRARWVSAPLAAYTGQLDGARNTLWEILNSFPSPSAPMDEPFFVLGMLLDAAEVLEDRHAQRMIAGWLIDSPIASPFGFVTTFARHLGAAAALDGDRAAARRWYEKALSDTARLRFRPEQALAHMQLAELLMRGDANDPAEGREHLATAIDELEEMHMRPALEHALTLRNGAPAALSDGSSALSGALSRRELDVLRLVAAGRSNRAIADELVISLNTVIRHVSNILDKTGAANRAEAAVYAARHELL